MVRPPQDPGGAGLDGALADLLLPPVDGRAGPARRLSSAATADLVRAILDAAGEAPAEPARALELDVEPPVVLTPVPAPPPVAPLRRPRWGRRLALAAAALGAVSLGSAASAVALRHFNIRLGGAEVAPEPPAPPPPVVRRPSPPPPAQAQEVELPQAMIEAPPQEPVPAPRRHVRRIVAAPPPPAPVPSQEPAPTPAVIVPENLPPADLLAFANERRARQAWREADLFYRATVTRFAGSDAASVAEVASAALHLQHLGDASGALAGFERTLGARPSGPLAEEARWGIAEAHRALGDRPAEARALREFLDRHPDSALAPAARRRLSRIAP